MPTQDEIAEHGRVLAQEIREWCRSQTPTWQRLPYLALAANGSSRFHKSRISCYESGLWPVPASRAPGKAEVLCFVDCETGELCDEDAWFRDRCLVLASDLDIVQLSFHLADIDAGHLALMLEDEEAASVDGHSASWMAVRDRIGLSPDAPYVRAQRPSQLASG